MHFPSRSVPSVVRRFSAALIAALLAVGLFAPASFAASPSTSSTTKAVPKVVFVVGPAGAATNGYRAQARAAAAIARHYTPDVVELYSPDATWPAVRDALQGASLVVYMGHGNGWPSKYRDALYPPTQDGFGLNPESGTGDSTHQYFGEGVVGSQVTLAKNAIVLLNHLCYASGLSEPGLPEGTLDQARQRVDNYAAGFVKAGASAVIAEAYQSPSYFVKAILGGGRSIQSAWQSSPSANGHRIAFESQRSAGYVAQMDTETATSGFSRSIVMKAGLAPKDVLAGAAGSAFAASLPIVDFGPTLAGTGITLGTPAFAALPSAGSATTLDIPYTIKNRSGLPKGLEASVRWDPIDVPFAPVAPADEVATPAPADPAPTGTSPADPAPATGPVGIITPSGVIPEVAPQPEGVQRLDAPADASDLVVAERVGDVVSPAAVKIAKRALQVPVTLPTTPGRYRLTVTLHDASGVAYDAASQALIPTLIIRVTGDFDGDVQAAPTADLLAGADVALGVRVRNLGIAAWGSEAIKPTSNLSGYVPGQDRQAHRTLDPAGRRCHAPGRRGGPGGQHGPADRPRAGQVVRRDARHQGTEGAGLVPAAARRGHPGRRLAGRLWCGPDARPRDCPRGGRPLGSVSGGHSASAISSRSMNGICVSLSLRRASSGSNQPTRSISGKTSRRPDRGGHSISNVFDSASAASRSPSTAQAWTILPPFWTIEPSGMVGAVGSIGVPVSSANSRRATTSSGSARPSGSPLGMVQSPRSRSMK